MRTSEYTRPLQGKPYYRNVGIIKVFDRMNRLFNVGEIIFERFDDQNFQYIIRPYWSSVDSLPEGLFQGIPGINMDNRRESYYRVNMTPSFISMRTPSESRENVRELMAAVGLDYYDRFEWLLRTETKCGDDNLIVVRKPEENHDRVNLTQLNCRYLFPGYEIEIQSLDDFGSSSAKLIDEMYQLLQSGSRIFIRSENRYIEDNERRTMLYLLKNMMLSSDRYNRMRREDGIREAKEKGKYRGRKPIDIDSQLLKRVSYEFNHHMISEQEAMKQLGLSSRSTFYRKIKDFSESSLEP